MEDQNQALKREIQAMKQELSIAQSGTSTTANTVGVGDLKESHIDGFSLTDAKTSNFAVERYV